MLVYFILYSTFVIMFPPSASVLFCNIHDDKRLHYSPRFLNMTCANDFLCFYRCIACDLHSSPPLPFQCEAIQVSVLKLRPPLLSWKEKSIYYNYIAVRRAIIENKGLRISRSKTEYLVPSHQQGVVKLEGEPLPSVNSFKYLGSVIDGSVGCGKMSMDE